MTEKQRQILGYLKTQPEGARPVWIAERFNHEVPWASGALPMLVRDGLVSRPSPGWYRITNAGREALEEQP